LLIAFQETITLCPENRENQQTDYEDSLVLFNAEASGHKYHYYVTSYTDTSVTGCQNTTYRMDDEKNNTGQQVIINRVDDIWKKKKRN
jgi:hypothetical protein